MLISVGRSFAVAVMPVMSTLWVGAAGASPANPPSDVPTPMLLWSAGAPGATGDSDEDKPAIYPYLPPADRATGAAFLICPGGGFSTRCTDFEGVLIARWLNARGIAGFILRYRIRPIYAMKESLLDAQRGMQFVRTHADEFHIAPNRIGMIGFSAGAELAASASLHTLAARLDAPDAIDHVSSRPDFLVLAYGSSPAGNVPADAVGAVPPTFMFCTAEDMGHLTGMVGMYSALRRARVPAEAHFFAAGEHGVAFAQGDPVLGAWPDLMLNWLRTGGFLTAGQRVALKGMVKIDGEPLPRGSIIFTPVDQNNGVPCVGYVFNTGPVRGQFTIAAAHGPTPGRYRVEVRQDAMHWVSNSQDPLQIRMNQKMRAGTLTEADRKEWNAAARARDLSPGIEGQRVYRTARPGYAGEWIVEVTDGVENHLDFEVVSK